MAEEQGAKPAAQEGGVPNGADPEEKDWKAEYERLLKHSRTWEDKAKRLKEKADRLDELEAQSMTDAERAEKASKRAEEAERELERYRRAEERGRWAEAVSKETGVPADVLAAMEAGSADELKERAESIKGYFKTPAAPVVPTDGIQPPNPEPGESANDWLRSTINR